MRGPIPCTRALTEFQTRGDYERETGRVIVQRFADDEIDPLEMPAVLVASHGPFAWGPTSRKRCTTPPCSR